MSVSLNCPNCGTSVGEASHEDGYKEKFYHKNEAGKPICKNCGDYEERPYGILVLLLVFAVLVVLGTLFLVNNK